MKKANSVSTLLPAIILSFNAAAAGAADLSSCEFIQSGQASWYGGKAHHGKLAANGKKYDQNALTAAHKTLPFGTKVAVVPVFGAAAGEKAVMLTITDRGPFIKGRVIDVSKKAAGQLGLIQKGHGPVNLYKCPPASNVALKKG